MSKFYVYNSIPVVSPASSKYGKDKVFPANTRFVVLHFDGKACEVKPAGKGNYRTIEVAVQFLGIRHTFTRFGPVVHISLVDFLRYGTYEAPYDKWFN